MDIWHFDRQPVEEQAPPQQLFAQQGAQPKQFGMQNQQRIMQYMQQQIPQQHPNPESPARTIKVASLNYSGVLTSPYQFYQQQNEYEKNISNTFAEVVSYKYPNFTSDPSYIWDMGSIDTKWKVRYSPFNRADAGCLNVGKPDQKLANQEEFKEMWEKTHQDSRQNIKTQHYMKKYKIPQQLEKRMKIEIQRARQFDFFVYRTLLKVHVGIDDINDERLLRQKAQQYLDIQRRNFDKPYLKEQNKFIKVIQYIKKSQCDIIFFQQANKILIKQLQQKCQAEYTIHKNKSKGDSLILIKKTFKNTDFHKENAAFLNYYKTKRQRQNNKGISAEQISDQLNFNNDSVFAAFDDFLFINVHLSSRQELNTKQMDAVNQELQRLNKIFPQKLIICGGDFNAQVKFKFDENQKFTICPPKDSTSVRKKRTYMQPQRNKANKLDVSLKDYILSNTPQQGEKIMLINEQKAKDRFLPNSAHPYDHFLLFTEVFLKEGMGGRLEKEGGSGGSDRYMVFS